MAEGIPAAELPEDDLRRELAHLKEMEDEIMSNGTSHQQANHRERTAQLEAEFLARYGSSHDSAGAGEPPPS